MAEARDSFYAAVYEAVQRIPRGKVTSYGHIALLIGFPKNPRQVGMALKYLPTDEELRFNEKTVPWQRVLGASGKISPRGESGAKRQADTLMQEGVYVDNPNALDGYLVDLNDYGWFPDVLPGDESEDEG